MADDALHRRQLERERRARREAEALLEHKSLELYEANQKLHAEIDERLNAERALKQSEQKLQRLAFYDELTHLPNRALLNDRLAMALASAQRQRDLVAVVFLDLDRFKYVNDTLGHPAGDQLLIEASERIERCLRPTDTVARLGGDEFVVVLTRLSSDADAVAIVERISRALERPVQLGGQTVYVGASIGISIYPKDGEDAQSLQKNADLAMYEAKERGRGQHQLFNPEMQSRGSERLALSVEIDAALENDEFTLFYQPIVNTKTGLVESVEALIRWHKANGESVPPAKFIPHAEQVGLIRKIDCWVLERACADAAQWLKKRGPDGHGRELSVCVNLSAVSVQQANMAAAIAGILQRTGLPPRLLSVEITETAVIADPHCARRVLEEIVALGATLSVDDFGTGYSSLIYLTRFPISCVKLDRAFIERIGTGEASEQIIESVIELARKLELRVIAEGVEHDHQRAFLTGIGCELMQGFHFVRPQPGDRILESLNTFESKAKARPSGDSVNVVPLGLAPASLDPPAAETPAVRSRAHASLRRRRG